MYDESYKRVMPKRYERRCRELADAANAAFADTAGARASKNYNMAYKMARKSVVYGYNQGSTRERNSQLQRLISRPFSTRFG